MCSFLLAFCIKKRCRCRPVSHTHICKPGQWHKHTLKGTIKVQQLGQELSVEAPVPVAHVIPLSLCLLFHLLCTPGALNPFFTVNQSKALMTDEGQRVGTFYWVLNITTLWQLHQLQFSDSCFRLVFQEQQVLDTSTVTRL